MKNLFVRESSGQATIETAVFLLFCVLMLAWTLNVVYFVQYAKTVHGGAAQGAVLYTQGDLTPAGKQPAVAAVSTAAQSETEDTTTRNTREAAPSVSVGSGCPSGFVDPEASASTAHGQFAASSVTTTEKFVPFWTGTIFGHSIMPFTAPATYTHTVCERVLN
jgi:hypothetical protein